MIRTRSGRVVVALSSRRERALDAREVGSGGVRGSRNATCALSPGVDTPAATGNDDRERAPLGAAMLSLARQTVVYGLSGVLLQAVGVVTLPIFTHTFSTRQYGVIGLALVANALVYIVVDLGLGSAAQRSYFDLADQQQSERRSVLLTATASETALACGVGAVLVVLRDPLSTLLFGSSQFHLLIVLIGINLPCTAVMLLTREAMRLTVRPWRYFGSALLAGVGATAASLIAVFVLHAGVAGLLWGQVIGTAASALFGLATCRGAIGGRWSVSELRAMLRYGLPLVPAAFAAWGLTFADRFMLRGLSSTAQVGIYTAANQIAGPLLFVVSAFSLAFLPYILSLFADDPELEKVTRAQTLVYLTIALATVAVCLSAFSRELVSLLAPSPYGAAYESIPLLAAGGVAFGINAVTLVGITYRRATHWFAIYTAVVVLVNVALNFAVIPLAGQVGAAAAQAAALSLLAGLYYHRAQRLYPTAFDGAKVLKTCALAALVAAVAYVPISTLAVALVVHAAAVLGFLALLRAFGVIEAQEIDQALALPRRLLAW